ncbi:MAG: threonylcarbamoyl-AMP synthase, partial [Acidobacteriota bacterium]|nr:threonylcarbamoyl-AMP synthase [Acidobacteriota bacterium]
PGLKHRHYSPTARVVVVAQSAYAAPAPDAAYIGLDAPSPAAARIFSLVLVCRNVEEYARSLFHFFRRCDATGVKTIYCQSVEEAGLGLALMDRINRAAYR